MRLIHYLGQKPKVLPQENFYLKDNPDLPKFQLGGGEGEINFMDDFDFPEKIIILARMEPVIISEHPKIQINLKENYSLYDMIGPLQDFGRTQSINFKLINVKDQKTNKTIDEKFLDLKSSQYFFSKKFNFQVYDLKLEYQQAVVSLFAYGGYYNKLCSLDQMEQLLFAITPNNQIHITRTSLWLSKGIIPPHSHQLPRELVKFEDKDLKVPLSLVSSIQNGDLVFNILGMEDENGLRRKCSYKSISISKTIIDDEVVEILLIKNV